MSGTESKEKEEKRPALNSSKQSNPLWLEEEMTTQDQVELLERSRRTIKQEQETSPLEKQVGAERNAGTSQSWEDRPEEPAIPHHLEAWSPAQHSKATITTPDRTDPSKPPCALAWASHKARTLECPDSHPPWFLHALLSHSPSSNLPPASSGVLGALTPQPRPSPSSPNSWVTLLLWWVPGCPLRTWPL